MSLMTVFLVVIFGCIVGSIAQKKNHSFWPWFAFGALLFIVALPLALAAPKIEKVPPMPAAWEPK